MNLLIFFLPVALVVGQYLVGSASERDVDGCKNN